MSTPLRQRLLPATGKPGRRGPSRRQLVRATAVAGLAGLVSSFAPAAPRREVAADLSPFLPRLREFRAELQRLARGWALASTLARGADRPEDRHTYAVDVAQLMWSFAMLRDAEPYHKLRELAQRALIVDDKDHPYTRGFVPWRVMEGQKPDASGTTEALRLARALWTGAAVFNRPQDAELALVVLDGYARHATVDKGIWMIANYFNFGTNSAATNTFVIDYDTDFVREVADTFKTTDPPRHKTMSELADNCTGLMRRVVSPSGLLYDLVQPELKTMYYGMDVSAFSPNDIIQTNNTATTASTIAKALPDIARSVLSFFVKRAADLHVHYIGRTGERVREMPVRAAEYCALARLAALLGDRAAITLFVAPGIGHIERAVSQAKPTDCWTVSELLIGLQAVIELGES